MAAFIVDFLCLFDWFIDQNLLLLFEFLISNWSTCLFYFSQSLLKCFSKIIPYMHLTLIHIFFKIIFMN